MIEKLELTKQLLMGPGIKWILWRIWYALFMKSRLFKNKFPAKDLQDLDMRSIVRDGILADPEEYFYFRKEKSPPLFFKPGELPELAAESNFISSSAKEAAIAVADDYCRGRFLYYCRHAFDLGRPVNWLHNPFSKGQHHTRFHWCDYPTFSPELGDVKDVWEPSRFACAFWLVKAYALTADERYPEAFWELFESWCMQNPPNMGPNWKCGQEIALRCLAWCFALYGFWKASETTPQRVAYMVTMLAVQADRIEKNIDYAISQKNNHGLSEAVGLFTLGLLFPELKRAHHWLSIGRKVLENEVHRQIYDDGSYVQHSMNYHRVMLHDCLWAIRLADLNGQPFCHEMTSRVAKAGEFLFQMLDEKSGSVPNYGPNDGALVLPLSSCDYRDYRPTVQAIYFQATGKRILPQGPWDEMLIWLFGDKAFDSETITINPASSRFDTGGYYTLRGHNSWCMTRCHNYQDRPTHVDMLHLDLWFQGINVLGDSGSFRYYVPGKRAFERYFKDVRAHNTIEIDEQGPLHQVSRFLWLPWPKAHCLEHSETTWQGEHYCYNKPPWNIVHRRTVHMNDDAWIITDELIGREEHTVALRWHLAEGDCCVDKEQNRVELILPFGRAILACEAREGFYIDINSGVQRGSFVSGWRSDYYGEYIARPTLEVKGKAILPVTLTTRIYFEFKT